MARVRKGFGLEVIGPGAGALDKGERKYFLKCFAI